MVVIKWVGAVPLESHPLSRAPHELHGVKHMGRPSALATPLSHAAPCGLHGDKLNAWTQ